MTTFYDLLQMHNKMRQSGYTPGHWEVSEALHDEMTKWAELRADNGLMYKDELIKPPRIVSLFGTPLEIREFMDTNDALLIAQVSDDIMSAEYHAVCVRTIRENTQKRLMDFAQRQREDFEAFSDELLKQMARLIAELPPIGSAYGSASEESEQS